MAEGVTQEQELPQLVVIGSSAGGIEALSVLVRTLAPDFPAPVVIAQHLDPTRQSHLAEILARQTTLAVRTVTDRELLTPGTIFVVPANRLVEITDGHIRLREGGAGGVSGVRPSVDLLLTTAARVYGEQLVAVILTGNGTDGTAGAREVHGAGGTVVIENPATAQFPGMPLSLSPTLVDVVADIGEIGAILNGLVSGIPNTTRPADERTLRTILEQLRERSGVDFASYKPPTIMRHLQRRMIATKNGRIGDYARYLQSHPDEYRRLTSHFLIKVTEFFRDEELYNVLRDDILPRLIEKARTQNNELRLWSAGTATGEEAYSLAILVAELLGPELAQFTVRIFATDLDNDAIAFARRGHYPASAFAAVPDALVDRYFTQLDGEYEVKKSLRAITVFGQHDLGQRAPFPRIDMVLCRNVLIYFVAALQRRALQLFAFSLRDGGYLVLGKAETTNPLKEYFVADNPGLKIWQRRGDRIIMPPARVGDSMPMSAPTGSQLRSEMELGRSGRQGQRTRTLRERYESLFLSVPIGLAVVDRQYDIVFINNAARSLLGIYTTAIGEDLIHLAQNVPGSPLRRAIDTAFRGGPMVNLDDVEVTETARGELRYLQIGCYGQKLDGGPETVDAVFLHINDVTESALGRRTHERDAVRKDAEIARLAAAMERLSEANGQLLAANGELSTSNAELRSANEEFLIASEEAQAATEEIETLNEELQATNEELETLNEELQSTVEELHTTNDDLQAHSLELQDLAMSLEDQRRARDAERQQLLTILMSMGDAVALVGADGQIAQTNAAFDQLTADVDVAPLREGREGNGDELSADETLLARAARGESFRLSYAFDTKDGTRRSFEVNGEPMRGGRRGGVLVIREENPAQETPPPSPLSCT